MSDAADEDDRWPDEPDVPNPEEEFAPDTPAVSIPDSSFDSSEADVSDELFRTFWGLVLTLNLAIFATSLGAMLVYFRGQVRFGGGVFVLGVASFAYAYYKYRAYQNR